VAGFLVFLIFLLIFIPVVYLFYFKKFITAICLLIIIAAWSYVTFYVVAISAASLIEGLPTINGKSVTFELLGKVWFGSSALAFISYVVTFWKGLHSNGINT